MSKSQTYRPFRLTAAQLAELACQAHVERLHQELLPELRSRTTSALEGRASVGLDLVRRDQLEQDIASASSVEALREVALELAASPGLDVAGARPTSTGLDLPARLDAPVQVQELLASTPAAVVLDLDVDEVEVTLDSIEHTAAELRFPLEGVEAARRSLAAARRLVADGRHAGAASSLADAADRVADFDAVLDEALAGAEARKQAVEVVRTTLGSMGFAVHEESDATGTSLLALAADGRRAEVTIDGDGTSPGCVEVACFNDGHALPAGHAAAGQLCDPAVADQLEIQVALNAVPGLHASRPITRGPATRGPVDDAARRSTPSATERTIGGGR